MIYKYQLGGLVYQPIQQSILETKPEKKQETITDYLGPTRDDVSFPVEPVKEWVQPDNFNWNNALDPEPENSITGWSDAPGKVYKTTEKEQFKSDLYNAYFKELNGKVVTLKDGTIKIITPEEAERFAKGLVAQDANESRWGQSSLARYYNFGGIKDFRANTDAVQADTKEHDGTGYKTVKQPFRKFKNLDEYVNYKIDLLGNSNYDIFSYKPEMMYRRLVTAPKKYATDPKYEQKMIAIFNGIWGK